MPTDTDDGPETSTAYRLIDSKLTDGLATYVAERRALSLSWRRIAIDLETVTGVDVTGETLRRWFPEEAPS